MPTKAQQPPNIVLIVADDMGYGDFGCFSEGRCHTPSVDHLVETGMCLTQHYSAAPVCAPARAGLLTGRYPHRTGAIDTYEARGTDRIALREQTLPQLLKARGYRTGLVGKWHNGALDPRYHPNARGFDEFAGFCGGWQDYWRWWIDRNGTREAGDGSYLTDVFTDEATAFIDRHRQQPFFLMVAYNAPHFPFQAPEDEIEPYRTDGRHTDEVATVYAMNRRMDRGVGRILERLEAHGLDENTLVMFTSDNGPQLGGALARWNCGYNGAKGNVYEGGIRVPMVLRWPGGGIAGGERSDAMVHFCDWMPTLLELAGAPQPEQRPLDGVSVAPLLRGQPQDLPEQRFWQWNRYRPLAHCNAAMRDGDWKVLYPALKEACQGTEADGQLDAELKHDPGRLEHIQPQAEPNWDHLPEPEPMLFNLASDPEERADLSAAEPQRRRRMIAALERWFEQVEADRQQVREQNLVSV